MRALGSAAAAAVAPRAHAVTENYSRSTTDFMIVHREHN